MADTRYWLRHKMDHDTLVPQAFYDESDARAVQKILNRQTDRPVWELVRIRQKSLLGFKMEVEGLPGPGRGPRRPGEDAWTLVP